MHKVSERVSGRGWPRPSQPGKAGKHRLSLGKVNIGYLTAVAAMPAEGGPLKAGRLRIEQQEQKLQRIGKPDVAEVGRGGQGNRGVAGVECPTQAAVGRTFRGHEQMFAALKPKMFS